MRYKDLEISKIGLLAKGGIRMKWVNYLDEIMNCIFDCLRVLFKQLCSSNSLLLDEINKLGDLKISLKPPF